MLELLLFFVFVLCVLLAGICGLAALGAFTRGDVPTNNPGTDTPPEDEQLKLLRSIDERLADLQRCTFQDGKNRWIRVSE